jgi:hypothetical protein
MMLTFFDLQDESNPQNGAAVREQGDLLRLLDRLRNRDPFFVEFVGENGYKLTIGIGNMGCVQYSREDGDPPYLMAVDPATERSSIEREFLAGNTPSPVPDHYLLPFERVKEIAAYFQQTGERSPTVSWEDLKAIEKN